ncbi:polypyrimidine tract-binding protein homolog 3 isoform X2 [Selaginella moellendorffii]|uniref:polypyrimidine tract-binding protein homolog 3 isoform X2 n=1 Tax=Selaginella moellendorffii TaxID=88036 RepID=UPI000D1C4AD9|nr:polypyrimidine tract-binding protein homolog 3 isoform X2 [Selaginella moellendorffii]XP_024537386.1 polypyrimidine tract-binding protein homolog 3 isoform X2 [Selaginella moellendorffii]|eukprot:XP_024534074.1 polypyrimidine tract-binding protein homolog 3 isoform X2 [Selaginella moellendorffii]
MTEPSKVLHVRNVGQEITESDLLGLVQPFGSVSKMVLLRTKNQALLQMQDVNAAISAMQYYTSVQPSVRGRNVYIQFSSHQELTTSDQATQPRRPAGDQDQQPNRILLVTIHHPLYPITVDVLHQVFNPHGHVEKIVTFQKSAGLQALIQYNNQQSAVYAKSLLQGRNIYDGCCTLDIQFSNLQELQVNFNNERTRDYTNSSLPNEPGRSQNPPGGNNMMANVLLQQSLLDGNIYAMPPRPAGQIVNFQQAPGAQPLGYQVPMTPSAAAAAAASGGTLPPGVTGTNERCTLLVSNLAPEVDADKLFNLFSNYGNIIRIKMLHNKPDHALIQMGDGYQAELAVYYLRGTMLFEKRMEVNFSKHSQINPSQDTHDYSSSNLNRFNRNALKNYKYCCSPTKMIHVSSLPTDITEVDLMNHLSPHGNILNVKIFEANGKKQALVHFDNEEQATEALVCKHATVVKKSTVRLAFSKLSNI